MNTKEPAYFFMWRIENTFGQYKNAAMRALVDGWAGGKKPDHLDSVYDELARTYEQFYPPNLAKILRVERDLGPPQYKALPSLEEPSEADLAEIERIMEGLREKLRMPRMGSSENVEEER